MTISARGGGVGSLMLASLRHYGLRTCSRPLSPRSFIELDVAFASSIAYESLVPVGPAKLSPDACSEALTLTDGRPCSVIRRRRTVSGYATPTAEALAGRTFRLARTPPCSSTISRARPRNTAAGSCAANAGTACCAMVRSSTPMFRTVSVTRRRCAFILNLRGLNWLVRLAGSHTFQLHGLPGPPSLPRTKRLLQLPTIALPLAACK